MKIVLKYILPLVLFVALMGGSEAKANVHETSDTTMESMVSDVRISTDSWVHFLAEPASSVISVQRVQNSSRQQETEQKRSNTIFKMGRMSSHHSYDNIFINQHYKPISFPIATHQLISLGKLII